MRCTEECPPSVPLTRFPVSSRAVPEYLPRCTRSPVQFDASAHAKANVARLGENRGSRHRKAPACATAAGFEHAPNQGRFGDNQVSTGTTALFRAVQLNDTEVFGLC